MKSIAFHVGNLSFRGTTTAILDYAYYNQTLLNNKSIIAYNKSLLVENIDQNFSKRNEISEEFKSKFDVIEYTTKDELKTELDKRNCDYVYTLKAGFNDGNVIDGKINLVHCTFNHYQPHGQKYAYVSRWLSEAAHPQQFDKFNFTWVDDVVPHIIELPLADTNILQSLGIVAQDKIVIGRYGGFDQFDIPFVHEIVNFIVQNDPKIIFLFVNTRKFIDHPQVIFLDPLLSKLEKSNFICSCDAMIHARSDGESFGLSIGEFLYNNKPVFSFGGGRDKNNVEMLSKYGTVFYNQYQLLDLIFKLKHNVFCDDYYGDMSYSYSPEVVMKQFDKVFLHA